MSEGREVRGLLRTGLVLVLSGAVTLVLGAIADNYVNPYFVWGGYDCTTAGVMVGCAGYPPVGIILLMSVAVFVGVHLVFGAERGVRKWLARGDT